MRFGHLMTVCGVACLAATTAQAQAGQRFSAQASALYADLNGDAHDGIDAGIGFEAQLRYNFQTRIPFSIGVGYQRTTHTFDYEDADIAIDTDAALGGIFVEPRLVINLGSERFAPYVSARISRLTQSFEDQILAKEFGVVVDSEFEASGFTVNGGGGILFNVSPNINIDVGATFGRTSFDDADLTVRANGQSATESFEIGSGTNFVLRAGLVFGFGGVGGR